MKSSPFVIAFLSLATLGAAPLRAQEASEQERAAQERTARRVRSAQLETRIEQLRRELDALERRRMEAEGLRADAMADSVLREVAPQIERAARALARLDVTLADATAMGRAGRAAAMAPLAPEAQPSGWMGVNYSGPQRVEYSKRGLVVYHYDYPVVVSIEPASPAERAGLMSGDTVVAYDGKDVRHRAIPLGRQLRPGARILVRVRRDGETLDVPVAIERRPVAFSSSYAMVPPPPPLPARAPGAPPRPRGRGAPAAPAVVDVLPVAPVPPVPPVTAVFGGWTTSAVAGAEVARMTPGLRDVFGVSGGVLVLSVAPGSPAAAAGLRSGDVIQRLDGAAVTSPQALQHAVQMCDTRSARLDVVRKKKETALTLKW